MILDADLGPCVRQALELDPVGSTVRYELMMLWWQLAIDYTGSVECIYAFIY